MVGGGCGHEVDTKPSRFVGRCQKSACVARWKAAEDEVNLLRSELLAINGTIDEQVKGRLRANDAPLTKMAIDRDWQERVHAKSIKRHKSHIETLKNGMNSSEAALAQAVATIADLTADLAAAKVVISVDVAKECSRLRSERSRSKKRQAEVDRDASFLKEAMLEKDTAAEELELMTAHLTTVEAEANAAIAAADAARHEAIMEAEASSEALDLAEKKATAS